MAAILLVEDVPIVRQTLHAILERAGHSVTACAGGEEAWPVLSRHAYDAVLTDLWMPNGDGVELIQRIRSSGRATPLIAMTGGDPRMTQSSSAEVATRAGADRVLMKPVTKSELLHALGEVLGEEGVGHPSQDDSGSRTGRESQTRS